MNRTASSSHAPYLSLMVFFALGTSIALSQTQFTVESAKDNTLYESPTGALSNAKGVHFFAGETNGGDIRRGLIQFDLPSLPAGSVIESVFVTLNMSKSTGGDATVTLHRLLAGWGEGTSDASAEEGGGAAATTGDATWLHTFATTSTWAAPGGDFSASPSASRTVGGVGSYTWVSTPNLVLDINAWISNPSENFGWLVKGSEGGTRTTKRFDTRESEVAGVRPMLRVKYTVPTSAGTEAEFPATYALHQNYPNPFNPSTRIRFDMPAAGPVSVVLYDLFGRSIRTIVLGEFAAGSHGAAVDATGLAAGVYYYRMTAGGWTETRRMLLVK